MHVSALIKLILAVQSQPMNFVVVVVILCVAAVKPSKILIIIILIAAERPAIKSYINSPRQLKNA
jgi:hypothetical protein